MKQELIKKIKDILDAHGSMLMPDVTTNLGDVYKVWVDECDWVQVDIYKEDKGEPSNPNTWSIGAEYVMEKDLEKILKILDALKEE